MRSRINKLLHKDKKKVTDYWQKSSNKVEKERSVLELRDKIFFDHTWITTVKAILEEAEIGSGDIVLDVGCGWGRIISGIKKFVPDSNIVGIDQNEMRLNIARDILDDLSLSNGVELVLGDADKLEFENNSFDVVVSTRLLQYVPDPMRTIREFYRVLKAGGTIVITVPNKLNPIRYLTYGRVLYSPFTVKKWFIENGLSNVSCRTIGFIPRFHRFHWQSKWLYMEKIQNIPILNNFGGLVICSGKKILKD